MLKIQTITDKGSGAVNEDSVLADSARNVFGVFDGATGLTKYVDSQGKTGALIASEIGRETFSKENGELSGIALKASRAIQEAMDSVGIDTSTPLGRWGTTAAVVRLQANSFEWLVVGDSAILAIMEDDSFRELMPYHDHDVEVLMLWKRFADQKAHDIRSLVSEDLNDLRKQSNVSYGVINGDDAVRSFIHSGEEQLLGIRHLLLLTDGLLLPSSDPTAQPDFQGIIDLYLEGGLEKVKEEVRSIEDTDPNCWEYPRYKQHDDIGAVAISF